MSESVPGGFPSEEVGAQNRDAVRRIEAEITEMDTVGFDDVRSARTSADDRPLTREELDGRNELFRWHDHDCEKWTAQSGECIFRPEILCGVAKKARSFSPSQH